MVLQKQTIPLVFGFGINSKADPKQLQGSLLHMENATMLRTGEIRKRNGFTTLGLSVLGGADISSALKLMAYNSELCLVDRRSLYTYGLAAQQWANRGPCPTTSVQTTNVVTNSYEQTSADFCYSGNTATYAWEDSRGGVRALVLDQQSGARILQDIRLNANGIRPRCFAIGQFQFVFYYDTVTERLICRRLDTLAPSAFSPENVIAADINTTTPFFDVALLGASRMVVAYRNTSAQLKLAIVLLTGQVGGVADGVPGPTAITDENPDGCLAVCMGVRAGQKDTFHVAWYNTSAGVKTRGFYDDFTTYKAGIVIDASTSLAVRNITALAYVNELTTLNALELFYERDAAADVNHYVQRCRVAVTDNTFSTPTVFQRAAGLASKAYRNDGSTKVLVSYASAEGLQDTYFSLSDAAGLRATGWGFDWGNNWGGSSSDSIIQAKMLSTVAGGHTTRASQLPGSWYLDDSTIGVSGLRKTRVVAGNVSTFSLRGVNQLRINHAAASIGVSEQLGQNLHIPGGFLKMFDGESVTEHGYHLYPESVTSAAGTTGAIANGTYQHVVVWEWIDAKGQIHRSAPSIPKAITLTGSNDSVTVTIPTLRYTAKKAPARSEVVAAVYRTTAGGSLFYKVSSDTAPLYNDTTVDTIAFVDLLVDASITSRPLLYTTGGVLENTPVSACDVVIAYKNRLFAAGLESSSDLRYSKEFVRDEGVAFSDALTLGADSGGGGIRAFAVLDDKLVLFKQSSIFILVGNGPVDTGAQNDFLPPQQIATDVGCSEPESVVLTPKGIMFKSEKGIYLLDRAITLTYVGDKVQDFNALNVSSAVLVADVNHVRFTTTQGTTLVYDYFYDAWSTFTRQEAVSAANWLGGYVFLRANGNALRETEGVYSDDGVPIRTRLETAWVSTAGLQGFQRVYRLALLGQYVGAHALKASLSYDFADWSRETFTVTPSAVVEGASYGAASPYGTGTFGQGTGVYQFELKPARQKCQSFKITLEDAFPEGQGTGAFTLSGITLVIGVKAGTNRLAASNTMTS